MWIVENTETLEKHGKRKMPWLTGKEKGNITGQSQWEGSTKCQNLIETEKTDDSSDDEAL